jgi:murein peptide amidase A
VLARRRWIKFVTVAALTAVPGCASSPGAHLHPLLRLHARIGHVLLGRSRRHRSISAVELRGPDARRTVLVVGCVHGNEPAGIAIARRLRHEPALRGVDLWILDDLNPDGVAARTRQNADGVDLNRNFPWRWRPLGRRGDQQYPGPGPLSEPEARIAHALILRLRPLVTIWLHQPLGVVDESGGNIAVERRFGRLARSPLRRLPRYPGSAVSWQDHRLPGTTAFVVELPGGRPSPAVVGRYDNAVRRLLR